MSTSLVTCAQWRTWLTEAYAARHEMAVGEKPVSYTSPEGGVTFGRHNREALDAYIARLESEVERCDSGRKFARTVVRASF